MKDKDNCGACYYYDDINVNDRTIYCILWQERRGQYDPCERWIPHLNDPKHIKEARAQGIRDRIAKKQQNKIDEQRHQENMELAKKGHYITIKWAIISIIASAILGIIIGKFLL
ncbi:MAG: hypothetical protein ACFFBD_14235 [Candidatus Hodarchaeota archaeon]